MEWTNWLINIGGIASTLTIIFYFLLFFKYKFYDKKTKLKINIYSTLTEHYRNALSKKPEEIRKYFLETFPMQETAIVPNEFISEKRKDIIANIKLTDPSNLAIIIGSDDNNIEILNFYDKNGKKIKPKSVEERQDMLTKEPKKIKKGQLKLEKGKYVAILTQELGPSSACKVKLKVEGHKVKEILAPNLKHGAKQYVTAKNTLRSYIKKHFTK